MRIRPRKIVPAHLILLAFMISLTGFGVLAQRELPIEKPRERKADDAPKVRPPVRQSANTSTVVVLLNPIVPGQVVIKSAAGKLIKQGEADQEGQASFSLLRGQFYQIEASSPGYSSGNSTVKPGASLAFVRINLNAQSRVVRLMGMPAGAEVLVDNKPVQPKVFGGMATIEGVSAGKHKVLVRHPEYNEYRQDIDLTSMGIGEVWTISISLEKVAKLTIQAVAQAEVLIDGVNRGRVPGSGTITLEVPITQPREHVISVEKPGYLPKTLRERLTAGPRTLVVDLEPFANPEGASDGYDGLTQWSHPTTWKLMPSGTNKTLQVSGDSLGLLKDKVYRDFQAVFTIWMPDGKGATWAMRADRTGKNYYLFHLAGPKSTRFTPNRFYTFVVRDGSRTEANGPTPLVVDLNPTSSFLIHVVVQNHVIEHSITSNETGERVTLGRYTDSSPTKDKFLYGLFGFRALGGEIFLVDDFTIDPSKETVTTRPR